MQSLPHVQKILFSREIENSNDDDAEAFGVSRQVWSSSSSIFQFTLEAL
jgi:hypothetical protein